MSQNQSAARTRHTRKTRLWSLTTRPALTALVSAGMIAGSAGMAVVATSSSAISVVADGPTVPTQQSQIDCEMNSASNPRPGCPGPQLPPPGP
jgi:hypothetical protein